MAPRAPAKGAAKRGATMEPSATMMAPPDTPAGSPMCLRSRSASVRPRTMTPQEFDEKFFTPVPAAAPEDLHIPQRVAELIVMNRDVAQNSIEGQSISPFEDVSRAQGTPNRAPSKQNGRSQRAPSKSATPSSGVTKSTGKGRKATPGAGNRASPATTPANPKLAAMLDELREHGRETEAATKRLDIALEESITAKKEARDAVRQVKKLTLAAKKDAIKMTERANRERDEALETTKEAWRIGERYR